MSSRTSASATSNPSQSHARGHAESVKRTFKTTNHFVTSSCQGYTIDVSFGTHPGMCKSRILASSNCSFDLAWHRVASKSHCSPCPLVKLCITLQFSLANTKCRHIDNIAHAFSLNTTVRKGKYDSNLYKEERTLTRTTAHAEFPPCTRTRRGPGHERAFHAVKPEGGPWQTAMCSPFALRFPRGRSCDHIVWPNPRRPEAAEWRSGETAE